MRKLAIAAALLMISATVHAGTYSYEGVTVHVQDGCRSSSCASVSAPGYGYYHGGRSVKIREVHKDTARVALTKKEDAALQAARSDASPANDFCTQSFQGARSANPESRKPRCVVVHLRSAPSDIPE